MKKLSELFPRRREKAAPAPSPSAEQLSADRRGKKAQYLTAPFAIAWKMIRSRGITKRWLFNTFGVVSAILAIAVRGLIIALRGYYLSSIEQGLLQRSAVTISYFSSTLDSGVNSGDSTEYFNAAQAFVEGFEGRDRMELQFLNASGDIIVSSTGFPSDDDEPLEDYNTAMQAPSGVGVWSGDNAGGEKVIAVTRLISKKIGSSAGAVRFVVSLEAAEQMVFVIAVVLFILIAIAIIVILLSGNYFINSIVVPVKDITDGASQIAKGNFNIRLEAEHDDEIGSLVNAINSMANELADSERVKNDFISSVSHELRTPLTAIKGWGETLRDCGADDPALMEKGMSVIIRESERLSGLVEDLLDFSRIQSGRMTMNFAPLDIIAEVAAAVDMFSDRCAQEGKTLIFAQPESVNITGDRDRLRQVFVNLIDNAIKYTDAGGTITVSARADDDDICVVVDDDGCGIAERDLGNVTRRFYKANIARRGFGIGLAVVEEIIDMHAGTLNIDSVEGKGTTVTVILPRR